MFTDMNWFYSVVESATLSTTKTSPWWTTTQSTSTTGWDNWWTSTTKTTTRIPDGWWTTTKKSTTTNRPDTEVFLSCFMV